MQLYWKLRLWNVDGNSISNTVQRQTVSLFAVNELDIRRLTLYIGRRHSNVQRNECDSPYMNVTTIYIDRSHSSSGSERCSVSIGGWVVYEWVRVQSLSHTVSLENTTKISAVFKMNVSPYTTTSHYSSGSERCSISIGGGCVWGSWVSASAIIIAHSKPWEHSTKDICSIQNECITNRNKHGCASLESRSKTK